jgi:hypothetical protein
MSVFFFLLFFPCDAVFHIPDDSLFPFLSPDSVFGLACGPGVGLHCGIDQSNIYVPDSNENKGRK